MQKTRTLILNCTQSETQNRLRQQLRFFFPKGNVEENHFAIYRNPTGYGNGNNLIPSFRFSGEFEQTENRTIVTYRISPLPTIYFIYALLVFVLIYTIYTVIILSEPIITIFAAISLLLFFYFYTFYQKKKCIADFEKKLATRAHNYK